MHTSASWYPQSRKAWEYSERREEDRWEIRGSRTERTPGRSKRMVTRKKE